jgi:hypothetical protein
MEYSVRRHGCEIGLVGSLIGAANLVGIRVDKDGTAWVNSRKVDHSYNMKDWTQNRAAVDVIKSRPDILRAQGYTIHSMTLV